MCQQDYERYAEILLMSFVCRRSKPVYIDREPEEMSFITRLLGSHGAIVTIVR